MNLPRVDLFFSYWLFLWFVLYWFHVVPYNPKWFLVVGIVLNVILILTMIYYRNPWGYIAFFVVVNGLMKVVPVWLLWNTRTKWEDLAFGVVLGMVYVMYFRWMMGSFSGPITKMIRNIQEKKPTSPFLVWWYGHSGIPF
jgi:hypothetical protein